MKAIIGGLLRKKVLSLFNNRCSKKKGYDDYA